MRAKEMNGMLDAILEMGEISKAKDEVIDGLINAYNSLRAGRNMDSEQQIKAAVAKLSEIQKSLEKGREVDKKCGLYAHEEE